MFVLTTQAPRAMHGYGILDKLKKDDRISQETHDRLETLLINFNRGLQKFYDKLALNIVRLKGEDIWEAEQTIATVVYPILLKLQKEKHGAPNVNPIDVPEHLRMTVEQKKAYNVDGTIDENYFARYDYIMDEMIFAFKYVLDGKQYDYINFDRREYDRVENGLQLFSKYYFSLWD